jgi:hypothetical protein
MQHLPAAELVDDHHHRHQLIDTERAGCLKRRIAHLFGRQEFLAEVL